jgi:hypothetical protein
MDLFNVVQFFPDGQYEYVRKAVSAEEAVKATQHYTTSVGARMGTTVRVIITDMMDCTCFEWKDGKVIYPTQQTMDEVSDAIEKSQK